MRAESPASPTSESFSGDDTEKSSSSLVLHLWQVPHLMELKPKAAPDWPTNTMRPNNAYSRQREPLKMTGLEEKSSSFTTAEYTQYTYRDTPEAASSGEQGTLQGRAPQTSYS